MIKLWLSVSLVLVNANACKVERCLMRHLLSAAPGGLCRAWLEFVPQSRSRSTPKHSSGRAPGAAQRRPAAQWQRERARAWRRVRPTGYICPAAKGCPSVRSGLHPSARPEPALERNGDGLCPTGRGVWYGTSSTSAAVQLHLTLGSVTGKNCWHLSLVTRGCWPVPPCDGGSLGEGKRGDAARQV